MHRKTFERNQGRAHISVRTPNIRARRTHAVRHFCNHIAQTFERRKQSPPSSLCLLPQVPCIPWHACTPARMHKKRQGVGLHRQTPTSMPPGFYFHPESLCLSTLCTAQTSTHPYHHTIRQHSTAHNRDRRGNILHKTTGRLTLTSQPMPARRCRYSIASNGKHVSVFTHSHCHTSSPLRCSRHNNRLLTRSH